MRLCRSCGGLASEKQRKQKHGQVCDACFRAHKRHDNTSAKARARKLRYEATHPGRRHKRVRLGRRYVGTVDTIERAEAIRAHIKRRMEDFTHDRRGHPVSKEHVCHSVGIHGKNAS